MLPARSKRKRNSTSTDSERKQYSCGKEIALFQWSRKRNSTSTNSERKQYFFCRFGQEYIFIWKRNWYFFIECGKEIVLLSVSERKQYFSQDKRKGNSTFAEKKQYIANGTLILSSFFRNLGVEKVPDGSSKISKTICSGLTLSIIGITR